MRERSRVLLSVFGLLLFTSAANATLPHRWSEPFGVLGGVSMGTAIAMDPSGGVVASINGNVNFGSGAMSNAILARFTFDGTFLWSAQVTVNPVEAADVAIDPSGNVFVTGNARNTSDFGGGPLPPVGYPDVFLAKYDATGAHVWSKRFGDEVLEASCYAGSVAVDETGNVVITGTTDHSINFGDGPLFTSLYIAKFDPDGALLWKFGPSGHVYTQVNVDGYKSSVAFDADGNVLITGNHSTPIDFGGGPRSSSNSSNIFAAKLSPAGAHIWSASFGDTYPDQFGLAVAADGANNILIAGQFIGDVDFGGGPLTSTSGYGEIFVAKFAPDGEYIWSHHFGDSGSSSCRSIAVDGSDNVILTGFFAGTVDFGGDPLVFTDEGWAIFLAKLDAGGGHLCSTSFVSNNGEGQQYALGYGVAANTSGSVALTGLFRGTTDFGGGTRTAKGYSDFFVAEFGENPLPVLITRFEATPRNAAVEIRWDVWSDEGLETFALYRRDDSTPLPIVIAQGAFDPSTRSYVDTNAEPGKTYYYELVIRTTDGDDVRSPVATATLPTVVASLGQNHPNPFNPTTTIDYTLGERSPVVLDIYDGAGALVARLDQGVQSAGTHHAEWDGRDEQGHAAASGVYFYRLEGVGNVTAKKMVLLK